MVSQLGGGDPGRGQVTALQRLPQGLGIGVAGQGLPGRVQVLQQVGGLVLAQAAQIGFRFGEDGHSLGLVQVVVL